MNVPNLAEALNLARTGKQSPSCGCDSLYPCFFVSNEKMNKFICLEQYKNQHSTKKRATLNNGKSIFPHTNVRYTHCVHSKSHMMHYYFVATLHHTIHNDCCRRRTTYGVPTTYSIKHFDFVQTQQS